MKGSILKRDKRGTTWLLRVSLGRDGEGKRIYRTETFHGSERDAHKRLRSLIREYEMGIAVEPGSIPVQQFLTDWLKVAKGELSPRTAESYEETIRLRFGGVFGVTPLSKLTPLLVQKHYLEMAEKGVKGRPLGQATIKRAHAVLHRALGYAVEMRMLAVNPASNVKIPKTGERKEKVMSFTTDQAGAFLRALEGHPYRMILTFALVTGMRPSEYIGLTWDRVDLVKNTVRVDRTIIRPRKGDGTASWQFWEPKTKNSRRTVTIPAHLSEQLRFHKSQQNAIRLQLGAEWQDNNLIFPSQVGTPLQVDNLATRVFKPLLVKAGLPSTLTLYSLRHSSASLLLQEGVPVQVVSERLGHSSTAFTMDVYASVLPGMQEAAADKIGNLLFAAAR